MHQHLLSPRQGVLDLRPGLAAFGGWWLGQVAYPEFQDTGGGLACVCTFSGASVHLCVCAFVCLWGEQSVSVCVHSGKGWGLGLVCGRKRPQCGAAWGLVSGFGSPSSPPASRHSPLLPGNAHTGTCTL
jgi:hypothetical protein